MVIWSTTLLFFYSLLFKKFRASIILQSNFIFSAEIFFLLMQVTFVSFKVKNDHSTNLLIILNQFNKLQIFGFVETVNFWFCNHYFLNCIISEEQSIVTTNNWILLTLVLRLLSCLWRHDIWAKVGNLLILFGTNISRYWVDNLIHIKILPSWILNCMVHLKPYIEFAQGPRHCETWKSHRREWQHNTFVRSVFPILQLKFM